MRPALGIVAALQLESQWIRHSVALVEVSGAGEKRAAAAARRLLDRGAEALVSWGAAGGLDPDLGPGTVVLPDAVIHAGHSTAGVDVAWRDRLLERVCDVVETSTLPLVHVSEALTSPEEKNDLYRRTGGGAVDMESAAVAMVAIEAELPFIAVRVVVDAADVSLPQATLTMCDEGGRLKSRAVLRLLIQPGEWSGMLKLGRANGAAGRAMRKVWSNSQPDLALSETDE